jgi:NAD+ kinase
MRNIYIFTGDNKDENGKFRSLLAFEAEKCGLNIVSRPEDADVIAVLGGDGTIMRTSTLACSLDIAVIGINLGRIGYMAELDISEISRISELLSDELCEEKRMTLTVSTGGKSYIALNDAVIHSKNTHMIHLSLYCNGNEVNSYRGDGLIFATPTGSTAYSMSAGGSVIDPRLECIGVTPICPQSLKARPFVFAPDSSLNVTVKSDSCILTVDGGEPIELSEGDEVKITRGEHHMRMIKLKKDGFYGVLRRKISE